MAATNWRIITMSCKHYNSRTKYPNPMDDIYLKSLEPELVPDTLQILYKYFF